MSLRSKGADDLVDITVYGVAIYLSPQLALDSAASQYTDTYSPLDSLSYVDEAPVHAHMHRTHHRNAASLLARSGQILTGGHPDEPIGAQSRPRAWFCVAPRGVSEMHVRIYVVNTAAAGSLTVQVAGGDSQMQVVAADAWYSYTVAVTPGSPVLAWTTSSVGVFDIMHLSAFWGDADPQDL